MICLKAFGVGAALLVCWGILRASDPVGVYAQIDRVVLEPDEAEPLSVQVWGTFAIARPSGQPPEYEPPAYGYLYYTAGEGELESARIEWSDLKSLAGTSQCAGFGSRFRPRGRVRSRCEDPAAPDVYPIEMGITKLRTDTRYEPILAILSLPAPLSPPCRGTAAPGPVTLVARGILDPERPSPYYLFEIAGPSGRTESSPKTAAVSGKASWSPQLALRRGETYTFGVQAVDGDWSGPAATATFEVSFLRGDANGDGALDVSDAVALLEYLFLGGAAPVPLEAADSNSSGDLDLSDGIHLLSYLFLGGPAPGSVPAAAGD